MTRTDLTQANLTQADLTHILIDDKIHIGQISQYKALAHLNMTHHKIIIYNHLKMKMLPATLVS